MERVSAIDLFCGAGGLSYGLNQVGISIAAGLDIDESCAFPFEHSVGAPFIPIDIADVTADRLERLWTRDSIRLLAGCAPCQPFSPHRRGQDTRTDEKWGLLGHFGRLIEETRPDLVTMENVPRLISAEVFHKFVSDLQTVGYHVDWRTCACIDFGMPQLRRRLVLMASLLGPIEVPTGEHTEGPPTSVRDVIGALPPLEAGETDSTDPIHKSRTLTEINMRRMRASSPGGTWEDWPPDLLAACHTKSSGSTFRNVYARMRWDEPAPTITTLAHNFGTGRFGHPEQDRAISLREAALLQGFPADYKFVPNGAPVHFSTIGRLIGNAVPPPLASAIGQAFIEHLSNLGKAQ